MSSCLGALAKKFPCSRGGTCGGTKQSRIHPQMFLQRLSNPIIHSTSYTPPELPASQRESSTAPEATLPTRWPLRNGSSIQETKTSTGAQQISAGLPVTLILCSAHYCTG